MTLRSVKSPALLNCGARKDNGQSGILMICATLIAWIGMLCGSTGAGLFGIVLMLVALYRPERKL